jgi:hypothetical protein
MDPGVQRTSEGAGTVLTRVLVLVLVDMMAEQCISIRKLPGTVLTFDVFLVLGLEGVDQNGVRVYQKILAKIWEDVSNIFYEFIHLLGYVHAVSR